MEDRKVHVPNVRAERGVTGDVLGDGVEDEEGGAPV